LLSLYVCETIPLLIGFFAPKLFFLNYWKSAFWIEFFDFPLLVASVGTLLGKGL